MEQVGIVEEMATLEWKLRGAKEVFFFNAIQG